ncbi:unnamed protein product [Closterium sp. NIES-54]
MQSTLPWFTKGADDGATPPSPADQRSSPVIAGPQESPSVPGQVWRRRDYERRGGNGRQLKLLAHGATGATGTRATGATGTLATGATGTRATGVTGSVANSERQEQRTHGRLEQLAHGRLAQRAHGRLAQRSHGRLELRASRRPPPFNLPKLSHRGQRSHGQRGQRAHGQRGQRGTRLPACLPACLLVCLPACLPAAPALLGYYYCRRSCRPGAGHLGASGSGQLQLQRRPRETLTSQQLHEWYAQSRGSLSTVRCPYVIRTGDRTGQTCGTLSHTQSRCFARLSDAWRTEFCDEAELPDWAELLGLRVDIFALDYDAILTAMYALPTSADRTGHLCATPDPGIEHAALGAGEAAALGASASPALGAGEAAAPGAGESTLFGAAPTEALYTFTLDSGASRSFFRDSTTLTPLSRPVPVSLADPSEGPVLAHSSTVLPCSAVPSGSLSGLHLPSFSTNLVSGADLQDQWVNQFTPGGQRVTHSAPCSCRALSHQTLLWHHRLGHPSVQRLRSMHRRVLVSGLPRVLPPLPPSPAPPCFPCVKGRQHAAPHSSSFPPTEAPLQTLHLDVWGPARVRGQGHERYFLLVVDDYTRYTTVFPLRTKGEVPDVLIPWIRAARLQIRERFGTDFPVLRLHSDRGGEFSSDLLAAFCAEHGIRQTFTLLASPQHNGVAEHRIGLVMEVARTSMIHAAAPHFLWPFAVWYVAHQLNLWPRVSLPETSPTLLWTGKVGDASRFRDVTFNESVPFYRLFPYRTAPLPPPPLFLAPGAPQVDPPPQPLFLAPGAPQVDPPPPAPGPAPSGVSQVDPPPLTSPVEVTGDSGPAEPGREESRGAEPGGTEPGGAAPGGAEPSGEQSPWSGCLRSRSAARGPATGGAGAGDSATGVVFAGGSGAAGGAGARGCRAAEGTGAGGSGAAAGAGTKGSESAVARSPWSSCLHPRVPLTSQQLHDWYGRRQGRVSGARGSAAGGTSTDVTGAGSGAGPGGARTGGTGAAEAGGAELEVAAAGDTEAGDLGTRGACSGGAAAGGAGSGGAGAEGSGAAGGTGTAGGAGSAGGTGTAGGARAAGAGSTAQPRLFFAPPSPSSQPPSDSVLCQCLSLPSSTGLPLQPGSPLPAPSPYTEQTGGLTERREPASRPVSPVRSGRFGRRVPCSCQPVVPGTHLVVRRPSSPPQSVPLPSPPASSLSTVPEPESVRARAAHPTVTRLLATVVTDPSFESTVVSALVAELVDFAAACRLDYATSLVAESASVCPPSVGDECALGTDVLEDRQEDLECLAASAPHLVSMLLAPEGDPDAPDIPTPRSYAEAITGPYSSQWQTAMDAEMASWKSTGTYVDEVPPPGANIVSGMWIFRVKRPPGSPPVFKARYVARGFRIDKRRAEKELRMFTSVLAASTKGERSFHAGLTAMLKTPDWRENYPNLVLLWVAVSVLPLSTVECERGFSRQNIIKSWNRGALKDARLGDLMCMSLMDYAPDWDEIVTVWRSYKKRKPQSNAPLLPAGKQRNKNGREGDEEMDVIFDLEDEKEDAVDSDDDDGYNE